MLSAVVDEPTQIMDVLSFEGVIAETEVEKVSSRMGFPNLVFVYQTLTVLVPVLASVMTTWMFL